MTKHGKMNYSKITEYIYLGTNACCGNHFKKKLLDKGIKADISMEKEKIDQPKGVKYFLWLPVKNHTAPTIKQLWTGVRAMEALVDQKIKIYLHCKNGHGRAPTMLAAYFIYQGMAVKEAIAQMTTKRPDIHIEPAQKKKLKSFADKLLKI